MMTPQEIESRKFGKSMRGYNVEEIDEFMKVMAKDYEDVFKENAVLKNKISVLVNKIEEYRRVEESLRNALLSAQQVGETVIRQANVEADLIMREAKVKAEQYLSDIKTKTEKEKIVLENLKRDTANFRNKIVSLFKSQIDVLSGIDELAGIKNPISRTSLENYRIPYGSSDQKTEDFDQNRNNLQKAIEALPERAKGSAFDELPIDEHIQKKKEIEQRNFSSDPEREKLKSLFFGFDSREDDE